MRKLTFLFMVMAYARSRRLCTHKAAQQHHI